ncbi:MAG: hypothetical protein J6V50_04125, partial [Clostridia bacterium]|nr:hypothetical protein [Clostridia bacterium]
GEGEAPTTVVSGGKANSIANRANLPFSNLFEITNAQQAASSHRDIKITPAAGKGAIIYVDAPNIGSVLRLGVYVLHENGAAYRYGDASKYDWFALKEGDTEWQVADVINYGVDVNAFKGYIYIPFVRLDQNAGGIVTSGSKITGIRVYNETDKGVIPTYDSLKISAPVIVSGDVDANISAPELPSVEKVTDGANEYRYFAEPKPIYDSIPSGVSIVEVAQFKAPLTVGMTIDNIPTTALNTNVAKTAGFNVEIVAPVGISGKPAVKVTGGTGAADAALGLPTMYFLDNTKAASAIMFYIDSTDAERKFYPVMGTNNPNGAGQYTQTYNGNVWILPEGADEWTKIDIKQYYFTLPAGFKGSVKIDYVNASFAYGPDVASVHQLGLTTIGPIAAGDSIVLGNPVHITRDGFTNEFILGTIVDGNTNANLGQIDGVVEEPPVIDDTSSDTSSEPFVAPSGITQIFNPAGTAQITETANTTLSQVDSLIPVTVNKSVKVEGYTEGTVAHYKYVDTTEKAIGVMFYLDTKVANPYVKIATGAYVYGASGVTDGTYKWPATSYQYGSMYYLAEGDTEWKTTSSAVNSTVKNFRQIPAPNGFKGYVYLPFNSTACSQACESAVVEYAYLQLNTNNAADPVYLSSYMLVKEFYADSAYSTVDNEKCIDMFDGTAYEEDTSSEESSSEESSSAESSSEESSSEESSSEDTSSDVSSEPADVTDPNATVVMPSGVVTTLNRVTNSANIPFSTLYEITKANQDEAKSRIMSITPVAGK